MGKNTCTCNMRENYCDCQNRLGMCHCNVRVNMCNCVARFMNNNVMDDLSLNGLNEYIREHGIQSTQILYEGQYHTSPKLFNRKYRHLLALIQTINNERKNDTLPLPSSTINDISDGTLCTNNRRQETPSLSLGDIHRLVSNLSICSCNSRKSEACSCQNRESSTCSCNTYNSVSQCTTRSRSLCDCNGRCSCNQVAEYSVCSCVLRGTNDQKYKNRCDCNIRNDYSS